MATRVDLPKRDGPADRIKLSDLAGHLIGRFSDCFCGCFNEPSRGKVPRCPLRIELVVSDILLSLRRPVSLRGCGLDFCNHKPSVRRKGDDVHPLRSIAWRVLSHQAVLLSFNKKTCHQSLAPVREFL